MASDHLAAAAELLEDAASEADSGSANRLREQADGLSRLVARDRGPDHGRLARITHVLDDLSGDLDGDAKASVDEAKDHIEAYRETVDGV
jgi:hypothetical protein